MNRLTRAELYRFLHSGSYFRILLICCVALFFLPMVQELNFWNLNLADNLGNIAIGFIMLIMFMPLLVTIAVANNYMKKTAYYEVMAGNKIWAIIGSKLAVEGVFVGVLVFVAMTGLGVIVAVKNGVGEIEQLGSRIFLLLILCLHLTFVSVLIGMVVKSIVGAMVSYLRFGIMETLIEMLLPLLEVKQVLSTESCELVQQALLMNQVSAIFMSEITNELVCWVVGCFLVEVGFWYVIVYYTMKKRLYK